MKFLSVNDLGIHIPTGHEVLITKVGQVTYGILSRDMPGINTVPHEDIKPLESRKTMMVYDPSDEDNVLNARTQDDLDERIRDLSFRELRRAMVMRDREDAGGESDWRFAEWTNALAGEVGELCNLAKKIGRDLPTDPSMQDVKDDIGFELADIVSYADLIAEKAGLDLAEYIRRKFNIVSQRRGSNLRL